MREQDIPFDQRDVDAYLLLRHFQDKVGDKALVVGAHDEPTANWMAARGLRVYGVDLRTYDPSLPTCNYTYIRADFCDLPREFLAEHQGTFDVVVALSAIEHFGLGTYQEGAAHPFYDMIAMRKAWEMLRVGGVAYITVPTGGVFIENSTHWRVYDLGSVKKRLIQDFQVEKVVHAACPPVEVAGRERGFAEPLTEEEVRSFSGWPPHISSLFILKKVPVTRLAPDGR